MNLILEDKLKNLPAKPGVYQFKNNKDKVIYVGKARNLRSRVKSYFHGGAVNAKTLALVKKISDVELVITDSEIEALVLENNIIKELKPRYNIDLKDDKSFPFIKITNEPYPQIYSTRRVIKDGSKYFGPYTSVKSMKELKAIDIRRFGINATTPPEQRPAVHKSIKSCDKFSSP